jgi:hypothetical protein
METVDRQESGLSFDRLSLRDAKSQVWWPMPVITGGS